jgi:hypothetical protein
MNVIVWWVLAIVACFGGAKIVTDYAFKLTDRWCPPDPPTPFDQERE